MSEVNVMSQTVNFQFFWSFSGLEFRIEDIQAQLRFQFCWSFRKLSVYDAWLYDLVTFNSFGVLAGRKISE